MSRSPVFITGWPDHPAHEFFVGQASFWAKVTPWLARRVSNQSSRVLKYLDVRAGHGYNISTLTKGVLTAAVPHYGPDRLESF